MTEIDEAAFIALIKDGTEVEAVAALQRQPALAQAISAENGPLNGATPLHWSGHRNFIDLTTELIAHGAAVNAQACAWGNHSSPLQWAADAGKAEAVQLLIHHQANIHYHEGNGHTALHCCAWGGSSGGSRDPQGYAQTASVLLTAGADMNGPGPCVSALTMALHVGNHAVAEVLQQAGAQHVYDDPKIRAMMQSWH